MLFCGLNICVPEGWQAHPDFIRILWIVHRLTDVAVLCCSCRHEQLKNNKIRYLLKLPKSKVNKQLSGLFGGDSHRKKGEIKYLLEDEQVEKDHAEVVDDQSFAQLKRFSVLHVFGPKPEEEQVRGADGQSGQRAVHQRPFFHSFVCKRHRHAFTQNSNSVLRGQVKEKFYFPMLGLYLWFDARNVL